MPISLDPPLATTTFPHPPYNPLEDVAPGTLRFVFHSTRASTLPRLRALGVDPPFNRNELSPTRAFYATNNLQVAYAHPLFVHPRPGRDPDPDHVHAFALDAHRLNGDGGGPDALVTTWYHPDDESDFLEVHHTSLISLNLNLITLKLQFAKNNFASNENDLSLPASAPDIVIAPPCIVRTLMPLLRITELT